MKRRIAWSLALCSLGACVADDPSLAPEDTGEVAQAASSPGGARWPENPIEYYIDVTGSGAKQSQPSCQFMTYAAMSTADADAIHAAIAQWEAQTPVRFTELTSPPSTWSGHDVLVYTHGSYATNHASAIPTNTSADYQGCIYIPTTGTSQRAAEHETGHMVGLEHEQRREDRDTYVAYDSTCADLVNLPNAWDKDAVGSDELITPYDADSLMEYASSSGCLNTTACGGGTTCTHPPLLRKTAEPGCTPTAANFYCKWIDSPQDLSAQDINAAYYKYEPALSLSQAGAELGFAMAKGDFDGDGYDDLAVGAPLGDGGVMDGEVFLYKGTEEGLTAWKTLTIADFKLRGGYGVAFGYALAVADFDGDGDDDLAIGAPGYAGGGAVFLYTGRHSLGNRIGPQADAYYTESNTGLGGTIGNDYFGASLAFGKLDGSHWHLAIGAPDKVASGTKYGGEVFVVRTDTTTWQAVTEGGTPKTYDYFGTSMVVTTFAGNKPGLVVSAPQSGSSNPGIVYLYRGGAATLVAAGTITDQAGSAGGEFGFALAQGFLLGNSLPDLVIGAPGKASGAGRVYVYQDSSAGYDTAGRTTLAGANFATPPAAGDAMGWSLAVGDMDGDGSDDLASGAPDADGDGVYDEGAIYLWRGGSAISSWQRKTEHADQYAIVSYDMLGRSLAIGGFGDGAVDLTSANDDDLDLAAGAPGRDASAGSSGAFSYWFGNATSAPTFGETYGMADHASN